MSFISLLGISVAYAADQSAVEPVGNLNPFADPSAILQSFRGEVLASLLAVCFFAAVIYIVLAGIRFITSNGDPEKAKRARAALGHGVLGIIIIVCAFAIINFIQAAAVGITKTNSPSGVVTTPTPTPSDQIQPNLCPDDSTVYPPNICPPS